MERIINPNGLSIDQKVKVDGVIYNATKEDPNSYGYRVAYERQKLYDEMSISQKYLFIKKPISAFVSGALQKINNNPKLSGPLKFFARAGVVAGSGLLAAACTHLPTSPIQETQGVDQDEDMGSGTVLLPSINPVTDTPLSIITSTPDLIPNITDTPIINTPTPEPEVCILDPQTELFKDASTGLTIPVLSVNGAEETFGEDIPLIDILGQVAFEAEQVYNSNPQNISKVIIPEYLNPTDVEGYLEGNGITQTGFEIQRYVPNADIKDIKNENTLLVSVHAGEEGWTTALWKNASITQRTDGSFMVDGEMMLTVDTDRDGNPELRTLPAQRIGTTKPDIAIVDGCEPSIIRVNEEGNVQAILNEDANILDPDSIWIQNDEVPLPTPTPDIQVVITNLISEFNLDPQRQYEMVYLEGKQYLVDTFNQAKMAKLEGGGWVDTTTEEKYGHLVPEGETLRVKDQYLFLEYEHRIPGAQKYTWNGFIAWNTGNMYTRTYFDTNLQEEVTSIYGTVVFPDHEGNIKEMSTIFRTQQVNGLGPPIYTEVWTEEGNFDSVIGRGTAVTRERPAAEDVMNFYNIPGKPFVFRYAAERPEDPPDILQLTELYSNIDNLVGHYNWHSYSKDYEMLNDFLYNGGEFDLSDDFIFAPIKTYMFWTEEEQIDFFRNYQDVEEWNEDHGR